MLRVECAGLLLVFSPPGWTVLVVSVEPDPVSVARQLAAVCADLERQAAPVVPPELLQALKGLVVAAEQSERSLATALGVVERVRAACRVDEFGSVFDVHFGDLSDALSGPSDASPAS